MIKNQIANRNDKSYENSILTGPALTDLNRAFESQRKSQQAIHSTNANELMTRMLSEGVSYLDVLLKNYSDLSTLRNSNGMSILHAAAASATLRGIELVKEIVKRNLISVNDHSKVCLLKNYSLDRRILFLFIMLSIIIIWKLLFS